MLKRNLVVTGILLCLFSSTSVVLAQENRGVGVRIKNEAGQIEEVKLYEGSYALVIGESDYTNGWPSLPGVKSDVQTVSAALTANGFTVTELFNPTRVQLTNGIDSFISDHGYDAGNRLLIYYAGHGHTQKSADGRDMGYIIPSDAPKPDKDPRLFRKLALSMDAIQGYAKQIEAKHTLFIFDSCFSGSLLTKTRSMVPPVITQKTTKPVRQFITAGSDDQEVPDVSVFRKQFVEGLQGEADLNNDGYITGSELADFLQTKVSNYTNNAQTPQYGKIFDPLLDKGDFVFVVAKSSDAAASNPALSTSQPNNTQPNNVEGEFWNAIKDSTEAEDFKLYKEKYPNGIYVTVADLKIKKLTILPGTLISNSLGMKFAYSPAGTFQMGDSGANGPMHTVNISRGFYLGRTEVTQAEWVAVMGSNPRYYKNCDKCPVEQVSWDDVQEFIQKLNAKGEGRYRLPTEAEWEYAARAGTTGAYAGDLDSMAWYSTNAEGKTHEVATKQPNAWGLYDMHGNVEEWVQDWWGLYPSGSVTDPTGPVSGSFRGHRGGAMIFSPAIMSLANRGNAPSNDRNGYTGFRLVRN